MNDLNEELEDINQTLPVDFNVLESEDDPYTDRGFLLETFEGMNSITTTSFKKTCRDWNHHFKMLTPYDGDAYLTEMKSFDLSVPKEDTFDVDTLLEAYSRVNSYRARIAYMFSVVNGHYKMYKEAKSVLESIAFNLTEKSLKDTIKKAQASQIISPLAIRCSRAEYLIEIMKNWMGAIEIASYAINGVIKEHENLSKINHNYENRGLAVTYNKQSEQKQKPRYTNAESEENDENASGN